MNNKFVMPTKMLPASQEVKYIIKLSSVKSPLLYTGINLCLSNNNEVSLHRLAYTSINNENIQEFYGPYFENGIESIIISPETDKWALKNIEITSYKKDELLQKIHFNCDMNIGSSFDNMAAYMTPIIKSDIDMTDIYNKEYSDLKDNILLNTAEFTLIGALLTACICDVEKAYAFALGGGIGLLYIKFLEISIDNMGKKISLFNNNVVRLGAIFSLSTGIVTKYKDNIVDDHLFLIVGLIGFTMYKLGLIVSYNKK